MTVLEGPWAVKAPAIVDQGALMLIGADCARIDSDALWCPACGEVHAVEVLDG